MKVAIYSGTIPSTTFIERLIIGLAESSVEIILHGKVTGAAKYNSKNITTIGYSGILSRVWLAVKFGVMFLAARPRKLFKLIEFYPNGKFSMAFLNWFVRTAPILWHQPDIFHLQWTKGCEEWVFLQQFGIKFVVSLRGSQFNISPVGNKNLAETYHRLFPRVDAFHSVNKGICAKVSNYGVNPEKCHVVYSGLDLKNMAFPSGKSLARKNLDIVTIGRQHWKKGYRHALDALKILNDYGSSFHYHIIGGVEEEVAFQVHDLGLKNSVSILDRLSFDRIKSLISSSDILLMPSVMEGVPNVVLEAMALGTIVVATDCGGVPEVITDGENGFMVPIRDSKAIAEKILSVAGLSDDELNAIRVRARKTVERQHDKQKMIDDMITLYRSVLSSN